MSTHIQSLFDQFLRVLNEAVKADPTAIQSLIKHRVSCNRQLADHPTIQVGSPATDQYDMSCLGLLNGIIEEATGLRVAATWDEAGSFVGFTPYQETS